MGASANIPLILQTNATEKMRIDSSGNVGIGTSSPSTYNAQLANYKAAGVGTYLGYSNSGTFPKVSAVGLGSDAVSFTHTSGGSTFALAGSAQIAAIQSASSSAPTDLAFYTTASGVVAERMRIDSSGNLLVGCTALPASNRTNGFGAKNNSTGGIQVYQTASNSDWAINSTVGSICNFYSDNGSALVFAGNIQVNSNVTTYLSVSDYRLKTVIGSVTDAGQRIDALQPIEYDWNAGGRTRGFLAHQFAEVYPSSVTGEKDAVDKDGKPVYQGMQASTPEVMADLIAEIQSLRKRIAALESK
jgi:hypothetical protein